MSVQKPGWSHPIVAALALVGLSAARADADPVYTAVNLIPGAVTSLNDSSQVVAAWGLTTPTVYNGYGAWAGETQPAIPRPPDGWFVPGNDSASVINNPGQVASNAQVGYAGGGYGIFHAVFYNGQTTTDLGTLGGPNSSPHGINDAGQVVGESNTASGTTHAFIASGGQMTDLGTLPGGQSSVALAVNNAGQAVGYAQVGSSGSLNLGLLYGKPGGPYLYGNPGGPYFGNDPMTHAVLYQAGKVVDLGTLGGANSEATAINQTGAIVGMSQTSSGAQHAFLYQNGQMRDLGVLNSDYAHAFWGVAYSQAHGINNAGEIVGESNSLAFLDANGKMYNLNDLVHIPGVTLASAFAINNAGQILAAGYASAGPDRYLGPSYEFLLNPVDLPGPEYAAPEPSTLILTGVLATWLAARRRRRVAPR